MNYFFDGKKYWPVLENNIVWISNEENLAKGPFLCKEEIWRASVEVGYIYSFLR